MARPTSGRRALAVAAVERQIMSINGVKVMLDSDLALLYGVTTKRLNEAVSRNASRFPADFMFRLSLEEAANLRSQFATSSLSRTKRVNHGGRRYGPRVFTEQGIAMLSSVLHSPRAIAVNIAIMRAFVRMRQFMVSHEELTRRLDELERRYDGEFVVVFDAIRKLTDSQLDASRRRIGFSNSTAR